MGDEPVQRSRHRLLPPVDSQLRLLNPSHASPALLQMEYN